MWQRPEKNEMYRLRGRDIWERERKRGETGLGVKDQGDLRYSNCMWAMSQRPSKMRGGWISLQRAIMSELLLICQESLEMETTSSENILSL